MVGISSGGSSPHTRGAHLVLPFRAGDYGIIPAYAGSTFDNEFLCGPGTDHPRIRGEHDGSEIVVVEGLGSSPHTRGARRRSAAPRTRIRIIPAYAGSTSATHTSSRSWTDHPRIRGEHRQRPAHAEHDHGIIPAYAGSTMLKFMPVRAAADHPRIRGEHTEGSRHLRRLLGSSPHTRGARHESRQGGVGAGIIPAYAGST